MSQLISTAARVQGRRLQGTATAQNDLYLQLPYFRDHKQPATLPATFRMPQQFQLVKERTKMTSLAHRTETLDRALSPMSHSSPNQPSQTTRKTMKITTVLRQQEDKNEGAVQDRHRWRRKRSVLSTENSSLSAKSLQYCTAFFPGGTRSNLLTCGTLL